MSVYYVVLYYREKGEAEAVDSSEYLIYLSQVSCCFILKSIRASQGIFEMKCGTAERALGYLNRAVDLDPEDETPYVVRSQCFNK